MNKSILIIDFELHVRRGIESILRKEEYQVRCASTREEVIGIFNSEPFDLVIMDIRMPETNGLELIKEVKKLSDDIEVIILTGSPSIENAVKAVRDYGVFDFLCKPLESVDQLTNSVKKALQKHDVLPKKQGCFMEAKAGS